MSESPVLVLLTSTLSLHFTGMGLGIICVRGLEKILRLQITNVRPWASAQLSFLAVIHDTYVRQRGVEEEGQQRLERSLGHLWCNSVFLFVVLRNCR